MVQQFWRWLPLLAVVAVGLAVRFYRLDGPVIGHDEAFSWRLTEYSVGELVQRTGADVHPPLYYVLLKGWCAVFGDSLGALRGLSVVFGLLAIVMVYGVGVEALRWGGPSPPGPAATKALHR